MIDNINIKKELLNSTKVKIGIVGSRRYDNLSKMNTIFESFILKFHKDNILIISGGAIGADSMSRELAIKHDDEKIKKVIDFCYKNKDE